MPKHNFSVKKLLGDISIFSSSVITLVIVFIITYTFAFALLSLKSYNSKFENSNQIILYLNDIESEAKEKLNTKILELPGVSSTRFESKEVAIKASSKELGIELPENENPLSDVFYVYLKNDVNIEKLKDSLVNMTEIKEIDFRTKALESSIAFTKNIQKLTFNSSIVLVLFGTLMIYNIIGFSVKSRRRAIHANLLNNVNPQILKNAFFMEAIIVTILATAISLVIYTGLKSFLINSITLLIPGYTVSIYFVTEIMIAVAILFITIFISFIINFLVMNKYYNMEYYNLENEKINEMIESINVVEQDDEEIENLDLELGVEEDEEE